MDITWWQPLLIRCRLGSVLVFLSLRVKASQSHWTDCGDVAAELSWCRQSQTWMLHCYMYIPKHFEPLRSSDPDSVSSVQPCWLNVATIFSNFLWTTTTIRKRKNKTKSSKKKKKPKTILQTINRLRQNGCVHVIAEATWLLLSCPFGFTSVRLF